MNIKIIVATHKKYQMPQEKCYLPLQVGRKGKADIGYLRDDVGENISEKNPSYCELTGMYWMWKNIEADYYGLVHYRRYFTALPFWKRLSKDKFSAVLTQKQAEKILNDYDAILPKKRDYVIESVYSHYAHTHYGEHLDMVRIILEHKKPNYLPAFDKVMDGKKGHMFNMFVMRKELFSRYCEWLFPILFELEKQIDISKYTPYQARYVGRISEILLNVWVIENHVNYMEIPVVNMEKINWPKKILSFLKAKFLLKRYDGSF